MKTKFHTLVFLLLAAGIMFTSCVSSKKFSASETKVGNLLKENAITQDQLKNCQISKSEVTSEKASLQAEHESLQADMDILQADMDILIKASNLTIDDQSKQIRGLNNLVNLQKEALSDLMHSLGEALTNYEADELSVYTKHGKVYVSLEEKLLFKSGSDVVDLKGKEALKSLSDVLNTTKDITVMIEGHTDNISIKTQKYKDNWDLSAARATSIVRILTDEYGFDPTRITASGKGMFQPVTINDTEAGRAANRRTEIILTPNLENLFKVLYQ